MAKLLTLIDFQALVSHVGVVSLERASNALKTFTLDHFGAVPRSKSRNLEAFVAEYGRGYVPGSTEYLRRERLFQDRAEEVWMGRSKMRFKP